jgi:hypothetical protein
MVEMWWGRSGTAPDSDRAMFACTPGGPFPGRLLKFSNQEPFPPERLSADQVTITKLLAPPNSLGTV